MIDKENQFKNELRDYFVSKYEEECLKSICFPCKRGVKKKNNTTILSSSSHSTPSIV